MSSVFEQTCADYEYIIIDGGSNDGSKQLIEESTHKLTYWVSEKDHGVYHAMNKGILKAQGDYMLFLNSGDHLIDNKSLLEFKNDQFTEDILCADILVNDRGVLWTKHAPDNISFHFLTRDTLPHQSALIKRSLFDRVGLYDESLRFVSDWKFYLDALCKYNASYRHIKATTTEYSYDGISSLEENAGLLHSERETILVTEYSAFYSDYKKYHECEASLRNYTSSRAHQLLEKIMSLLVYKILAGGNKK